MGRYTTVQAYSDTNQNTRSVSYEQATGSASSKTGAVKAEKVDNPYGSTAGAGSGEFHVYRHARAREMARMKQLDEEEAEQKADAAFEEKVSSWKNEEDQKTEKRRRKRQREKEAKLRKKNMKLGGVGVENAMDNGFAKGSGEEEEEFDYTPLLSSTKVQARDEKIGPKSPGAPSGEEIPTTTPASSIEFADDGSFLELMKKKLNNANKPYDETVAAKKKKSEQTVKIEEGSNIVSVKQE
mmetsp:Transcript_37007/g.110826  ORF Transcript_37007/g.110826 Transcript_37007/m.110826 type:complete len:240 (-) Transcript_37007:193-912(-)|eukprot:CAMPEP_0113577236 /NCGR_PEP_ID=MMETSP0015_2-20120614/28763_1 /TAXON_ID=2838 /ORGANISM="Odontella" /LENGTH=239 /DNA_ID=CAMNT_0000480807 /DNA_START=54 /DNA_END=773 /DNA_ORIENTATION=+ /assembly_acc=CAM_ASM_000160